MTSSIRGALAAAAAVASAGLNASVLTLTSSIPLPAITSVDAACLDATTSVLYLASSSNGSVLALNASAGYAAIAAIADTAAPQGVLPVRNPSMGTVSLFVAARDGSVSAFSLPPAPLQLQYSVDLGDDADDMLYDALSDVLWVGYGNAPTDSGAGAAAAGIAYIQASTGVWMGTVALPSHPFGLVQSPVSNLMYFASGTAIVSVDRRQLAVASTWRLPFSVTQLHVHAIDAVHARLFVTARSSVTSVSLLLVLNAFDGSVVWSTPTSSGDCGSVQYDDAAALVYAACGGTAASGVLIVQQGDADSYTVLGAAAMPALVSIRTSNWDAAHAVLAVAVPFTGPDQAAQLLVFERILPSPLPAPTCAAQIPCPSCAVQLSRASAIGVMCTCAVASALAGALLGAGALYRSLDATSKTVANVPSPFISVVETTESVDPSHTAPLDTAAAVDVNVLLSTELQPPMYGDTPYSSLDAGGVPLRSGLHSLN